MPSVSVDDETMPEQGGGGGGATSAGDDSESTPSAEGDGAEWYNCDKCNKRIQTYYSGMCFECMETMYGLSRSELRVWASAPSNKAAAAALGHVINGRDSTSVAIKAAIISVAMDAVQAAQGGGGGDAAATSTTTTDSSTPDAEGDSSDGSGSEDDDEDLSRSHLRAWAAVPTNKSAAAALGYVINGNSSSAAIRAAMDAVQEQGD